MIAAATATAAELTLRGVMEDRRGGRRDGRSLLDHRVYLVLVVGGGQRPNHLVNSSEFLHQVTTGEWIDCTLS